MPRYRGPSKYAGPPMPRKQLASKAARKSVPYNPYLISSDSDSDSIGAYIGSDKHLAELKHSPEAGIIHRPNGARYRIPRSKIAGPAAPRKQLASKAARKTAPSALYHSVPAASSSAGRGRVDTPLSSSDEDSVTDSPLPFCREHAARQDSFKRARDLEEEGRSNHAKRQRTSGPSRRLTGAHQKTANCDDLLQHVSLDGLKSIFREALLDDDLRPRLEQMLKSKSDPILDRACDQAAEECAVIQLDAERKIELVEAQAWDIQPMQSSSAWGDAMKTSLPRIARLCDRGPLVNGPQEAWMGLLGITRLSMRDWDDGEPRLHDGEDANDGFHNEVDKQMLEICRSMMFHKHRDWLKDGRAEELWELQERPREPCTYRYQRTLGFLEQYREYV